jgi:glycosyltransferase involved in cell wall biosynthesis
MLPRGEGAKPRILLFSNWFAPGYKGGGSQLAAVNLVRTLIDQFDFWVVTSDRDAGDTQSYGVENGQWADVDGAHVLYLRPDLRRFCTIWSLVRSREYDLIHVNSVFSIVFAAYPLFARLLAASETPFVVSPHGEMASPALAKKPFRKSIYLKLARAAGLFRRAHWHATSMLEKQDIEHIWGNSADVAMAPLLPPAEIAKDISRRRPPKTSGKLRAAFLSRIDRMKNLDVAIEAVSAVPDITLDIYGPIGQQDYWLECRARIERSARPEAFTYREGVNPGEVLGLLSQHDLLLQLSQSENFGYSILESLAAGCPVLISDRTPWRNLIEAGVGFDVSLSETGKMQDYLIKMRDLDETVHAQWRKRARTYALDYVKSSPAQAATRAIYAAALSHTGTNGVV